MQLIQDGPADSPLTLLLAHGAGTPMDHPFLNTVAAALAERGTRTVRFEFPYMAQRRSTGARRAPDRPAVLEDSFREAASLCPRPFVVGGKSMGGRIATMVADDLEAAGVLVFGYPFHPPGRPEKTRVSHLHDLRTPTLIVQGTEDPFGTRQDVEGYALSSSIRIHWIEGAGHDLLAPSLRRKPLAEALAEPIARAAAFLQELASPSRA